MKVQYTIRVESDLLEKARIAAEKDMRSLNNLIEKSIAFYLQVLDESERDVAFRAAFRHNISSQDQ